MRTTREIQDRVKELARKADHETLLAQQATNATETRLHKDEALRLDYQVIALKWVLAEDQQEG